ncbi:hypothetical protein [Luteipulveratus mongoliensis]|uniref:Uncharacterized protein n=1 Tax=Luteipulveratus mongoliensis TaxID=571913 RepID=A0A0K1JGS1_9MICO|nr:hypothetical protein [Luteipulveratus mongoliensis]AKU15780.1 hypothetical protein VV02_07795 [Luteipulveratus mongoliensis]
MTSFKCRAINGGDRIAFGWDNGIESTATYAQVGYAQRAHREHPRPTVELAGHQVTVNQLAEMEAVLDDAVRADEKARCDECRMVGGQGCWIHRPAS